MFKYLYSDSSFHNSFIDETHYNIPNDSSLLHLLIISFSVSLFSRFTVHYFSQLYITDEIVETVELLLLPIGISHVTWIYDIMSDFFATVCLKGN